LLNETVSLPLNPNSLSVGGVRSLHQCDRCDHLRTRLWYVMAFKRYRRTQIAEMEPWVEGYDMTGVSVSASDLAAGSPKTGDMIARNPKNHADRWLVAAMYFADHFERVED
jgi:hypothetical protein